MKQITIAIGADHRGYAMKEYIKKNIVSTQYAFEWLDVGAHDEDRSDYPEYAIAVAQQILNGTAQVGILLCGTGVGMAITANRFAGVYAALAWNEEVARLAKEDDNANVLVLPSDFVSDQDALSMTQIWLEATFKKGRYGYRIAMIDAL